MAAADDDSALPTSLLLSARAGQNAPHELSRLGIKRVVEQSGLHLTDFEVSALLKGLDADGNNTVPLELLQAAVLQRPPGPSALGASGRSAPTSGAGMATVLPMAHRAPLPRRTVLPVNVQGSLASPIKPSGNAHADAAALQSAALGGSMGRAGVMLAQGMGGAPSPVRPASGKAQGIGSTQPYAHSGRRTATQHSPRVASEGSRMVTTKQLSDACAVTHPDMGQTGYHNLKPREALRELQRRVAAQLAEHGAVVDASSGSLMDGAKVAGVLGAVQRRVAAHIGSNDPYALASSYLRATQLRGSTAPSMRKPQTQLDREEAAAAAPPTVGRMEVDAASTQAHVGAVPYVEPHHVVDMLQGTLGAAGRCLGQSGRTQASLAGTASYGNKPRSNNPHRDAGGYVTRTTALRQAMGSSRSSAVRPSTAGGRMQAPNTGGAAGAMLDFDGFVAYTRRSLGLRFTPSTLHSIFDLFDSSGCGRVNMLHVVRSAGLFLADDPAGGVQGGVLSREQQHKAAALTQQLQDDEQRHAARYLSGSHTSAPASPGFPTAQQLYGEARGTSVRSSRAGGTEAAAEHLLHTVENANAAARGQRAENNGTQWEYRSTLGKGRDGWLTSKRPTSATALARRNAPSASTAAAMEEVREALSEHVEGVRDCAAEAGRPWQEQTWPSPPTAPPVQTADVRRAVEDALGDTARSDAHRGTALLHYVQETRPTAGVSSRVLTGEAAARSSGRAPTTENDALHRAALEEVAPTVAALARDGAMQSIGTTPATPPRSYRRGASSYATTTDERAIGRAEAKAADVRAAARAQELRNAEGLESLLEEREITKARMLETNRAADEAAAAAAAAAAEAAGSTLRSTHGAVDAEHEWNTTPLANTGLKRDGVHLFDRIRSPYLGAIPRGPAAMPELNHRLPTPPERSDTARSTQALAFVFETGADAEQQPGKDVNGYGPRPQRTQHDRISSSGPAGTHRRTRQLQQALDNGGRPVGEAPRQYAYITVYNAVGKSVRKKVFLPDSGSVVCRDFGRSSASSTQHGGGGHMGSTFASTGRMSTASLASTQGSMSARSTGRRVRLPGEGGTLALQQQRW